MSEPIKRSEVFFWKAEQTTRGKQQYTAYSEKPDGIVSNLNGGRVCLVGELIDDSRDKAVERGIRRAMEELGIQHPHLLPCGCYQDACYCGQYPTDAEMMAKEQDAEALRPVPIPMTAAEMERDAEARNFHDKRCDIDRDTMRGKL